VALSPSQRPDRRSPVPRRRAEPQVAVASPCTAVCALFPVYLSTVHAHCPCSQTFRAPSSLNACTAASAAAPTRPRRYAHCHSRSRPVQTTQVCYACRELPPGQTLSKTKPGRPRSANAGEPPPRETALATQPRRPSLALGASRPIPSYGQD
jgi:hypothetical protein